MKKNKYYIFDEVEGIFLYDYKADELMGFESKSGAVEYIRKYILEETELLDDVCGGDDTVEIENQFLIFKFDTLITPIAEPHVKLVLKEE